MTTCLRWPILIQPKQIPMQLLLYKTTTCLAWPATTFICLTNKKNFFKTTTIEIQPAKKWWTNIRRKCIKNKRLYPANTKRLYQRRSSVEFRRRNDVVTQSQWKCWYDVETRRYSIVSSWRRDNVVSTSEQPQTTSIKGCLNVVMRRGNVVSTFPLRLHCDVRSTSVFDVIYGCLSVVILRCLDVIYGWLDLCSIFLNQLRYICFALENVWKIPMDK